LKKYPPFFTLLLVGLMIARPYIWPTNASQTLTTVFGDARPQRFHAGMDIRTWGKTGYDLYAIDDGYIQRIRTGSKGYGKAIYLKLNDGSTVVYAHLDHFTPKMDHLVRTLQESAMSYTIDHYFPPLEYPVNQGEIIGISGDTGTISGPHLHFEIRDENENPVNPQLLGLSVKDTSFPEFFHLGVIPLSLKTRIDDSPVMVGYSAQGDGLHRFVIPDTINIFGSAGLAVEVKDKLDGQPFNFGLYSIKLEIDSLLWFQREYDSYAFREEPLSAWDSDFALSRMTGEKYSRLFQEPSINVHNFVKHRRKDALSMDRGYHSYRITASDFAGNSATLSGIFNVIGQPAQDGSLDIMTSTWVSHFAEMGTLMLYQLNHGLVLVKPVENPQNEFLKRIKTNPESGLAAFVLIDEKSYPYFRKTDQSDINVFGSVKSTITGIRLEPPIADKYIQPGEPFEVWSSDSSVVISGPANCFYFPALVWISGPANEAEFPSADIRFGPVAAGPELIPFKQEMHMSIRKQTDQPANSAIYVLDRKKNKWSYMNTIDEGKYLSTTLLSSGEFAVITESAPPVVENIFPSHRTEYSAEEVNRISFNVHDTFSGIDGEGNVSVILDGKPLIFEYNYYKEKVNYSLWDALPSGTHQLEIMATDNVENSIEIKRTFTIR